MGGSKIVKVPKGRIDVSSLRTMGGIYSVPTAVAGVTAVHTRSYLCKLKQLMLSSYWDVGLRRNGYFLARGRRACVRLLCAFHAGLSPPL